MRYRVVPLNTISQVPGTNRSSIEAGKREYLEWIEGFVDYPMYFSCSSIFP